MKKSLVYTFAAISILLIAAAVYLYKFAPAEQCLMLALPYLCLGLGCGLLGQGLGGIIGRRKMKNHPELQKSLKIAAADERNITIACLAKSKAYDCMLYIFGALLIALALMNAPLHITLLLAFCYLLIIGICIYNRSRLEKEL